MAEPRKNQGPRSVEPALQEFLRILPAYGLKPTPRQVEQLRAYVTELLRWNEKINLTAAREPKEVFMRHVLDSLIPLAELSEVDRLLDVGPGGGLPGIPIKIFRPELSIVLLEARRKRASFNRHIADRLDLTGVEVVWGRLGGEDVYRRYAETPFDGIITRAALSGIRVLRLGARLLRPGGTFFLMMGGLDADQRQALEGEAGIQGRTRIRILPYDLPGPARALNLVLIH